MTKYINALDKPPAAKKEKNLKKGILIGVNLVVSQTLIKIMII